MDGVSVDGVSVDGVSVDGVSVDGVSVDGVSVDGVSVDGVSVDGVSVDGVSVDGVSVDGVSVDGVSVDGVSVDGVSVDGVPGVGLRRLRGLGLRGLRLGAATRPVLLVAHLAHVGDERAGRRAAGAAARRHPGDRAGTHAGGLLFLHRDLVAVVDPHLHADDPERRLGLRRAVVDLGPERVQRDPAFAVPLAAGHLGAAEAAAALHPDALGAGAHRRLHGPAHGPAERHPAGQLLGHALREQGGVGLRPRVGRGLVHVLDLDVDALAGDALEVLADALDLGPLAADHDARAGRADEHPHLVALALDVDRGDAGARQPPADVLADADVLMEVRRVVASGVPVRLPGVDDPQPEPVRVDLMPH